MIILLWNKLILAVQALRISVPYPCTVKLFVPICFWERAICAAYRIMALDTVLGEGVSPSPLRNFWLYKSSRWLETALPECSKLYVHWTDQECAQHPLRNSSRASLLGALGKYWSLALYFFQGSVTTTKNVSFWIWNCCLYEVSQIQNGATFGKTLNWLYV